MAAAIPAGKPITVAGNFSKTGDGAPEFTLSKFRNREFHGKFGMDISDGALRGLNARGVVVPDENSRALHAERVPETKQEPDYGAARAALK